MSDTQELPTGIGGVFPFGDEKSWRLRLKVISLTSGIRPSMKRDDKEVRRASYDHAKSRTILNWSSNRILSRLGYPQAVMTLEVEDTKAAAELALRIFNENGCLAEVVDSAEVEPGIPARFMHFVLVPGQVPLLFWPKKPDPALLAQMVRPELWTEEV